MAQSKCANPSCQSSLFELVERQPSGSDWKYYYLHCVSCGTVVGFTDYYNLGNLIKKQSEAIRQIAQSLNIHVDL